MKLLTVHRAKGLEWDAVFLVGVVRREVPGRPGRARSGPPSPGAPGAAARATPPTCRSCAATTSPALERATADGARPPGVEELRLGYVAFTRARTSSGSRRYQWGPTRQKPRALALPAGRARAARRPRTPSGDPLAAGAGGRHAQPLHADPPSAPWPPTEPHRRARSPARGGRAGPRRDGLPRRRAPDDDLDSSTPRTVGEWDAELERLVAEARREPLRASSRSRCRRACRPRPLPGCATIQTGSPRELARPMPRQPSPAARFGTRFHAWVEARFGQQSLLDPDDLPGRGDLGIDDEDDLRELIGRFESGPFADRVAARGRGAVRARAGRTGRARAHRRGLRRARRRPGWSSTGRPTADRPQIRCSWRSTGLRGPS